MQQRFELRGHHEVDEENREPEREQQRLDRRIELLALATDTHLDAGSERMRRDNVFHLGDRAGEVAVTQAR